MAGQKIRIRLKSYDHEVIDSSAKKIVDTVGAGDGFAAGVLSAVAEGLSLSEAARRGTVIGSIQITHRGDNEGLPTRTALEAAIQAGIV